ncbi:hypothetical protein FBZ87_10377 [Nitrospirillum amazonense]|uniref:Nuclease-like protein n=1 Tax=Nitrospirillum amazonense TaxID=28077 RepID=A0A560K1S4_9PROT|nr:hypothetical protein [Nitrospirillum amazonense]TWB77262.1 hypothetical protein FBZ87_10377 [Nitrospirillum amazonense]
MAKIDDIKNVLIWGMERVINGNYVICGLDCNAHFEAYDLVIVSVPDTGGHVGNMVWFSLLRQAVDRYLNSGGIIFVHCNTNFFIPDGVGDFVNLIDIFHFNSIEYSRKRASGLVIASELAEYFKDMVGNWNYQHVIMGDNINPLLVTKRSNEISAGWIEFENGGVVTFLPPANINLEYLDILKHVAVGIKNKISQEKLPFPSWAIDPIIPGEIDFHNKAFQIKKKIENLESELFLTIEKEHSEAKWKGLFTSYGSSFVQIVMDAFKEIGIKSVNGPHPHADIIALVGGSLFAIEVKGLVGGAKSANVAQCSKWVSELYHSLVAEGDDVTEVDKKYRRCLDSLDIDLCSFDDKPHGMIVLNTYRDTPPWLRDGEDFVHNVVVDINREKFRAMTGLSLLKILIDFRSGALKSEDIAGEILGTTGVIRRVVKFEDGKIV